ncbi:glutamine-hydrolyzing carbamoyl-phosphate synthase small subunit [Thorsellia anophelis]|uniref:Carbamoyl phosphate synthase small chain n=1 Tax=Thorsellia anophelis DSM 18579 TaxID=1123402 RepID=A0A1H9ZXI2_9GAMM|nr:glutamine-hydrolyzing carbamoyl-phosphate synthase small subunit [Thorsellia anophelis]SES86519.1 carbamoyl-phosphate synthase small subunit [Thorsellia anophelis DSM 18579]
MQAILVLEDGSVFHGKSIGVAGETVGEVVFNTSITGYQEILTDPSYSHQIVTLTYPHIGNTGINPFDEESNKLHLSGLVIRELPTTYSDYRATDSLSNYLKQHNIVAIAEIDTRQLTRLLRDKGAQKGCIISSEIITEQQIEKGLANARNWSGLNGLDLAKEVTCKVPYEFNLVGEELVNHSNTPELNIVVYDFGVKKNILTLLAKRGCKITVVPAKTPINTVLALKPDGVMLSNGPGDPAACDYAVLSTQSLLDKNIPIFGICLGHQILALASGAKTVKMKFGHHGANHPVKDRKTDLVAISVQNHGFAVDAETLPAHLEITHHSLFDGSIQGIKHLEKPAFGFQGHPEASPGPNELETLFDTFIEMVSDLKYQSIES